MTRDELILVGLKEAARVAQDETATAAERLRALNAMAPFVTGRLPEADDPDGIARANAAAVGDVG